MEKNNKTNIIASVGYPTTRDQPVSIVTVSRVTVKNTPRVSEFTRNNKTNRIFSFSANLYGDYGIEKLKRLLGDSAKNVQVSEFGVNTWIQIFVPSQKAEKYLTENIVKGSKIDTLQLRLIAKDDSFSATLEGHGFITTSPAESQNDSNVSEENSSKTEEQQTGIDISDDDLPF